MIKLLEKIFTTNTILVYHRIAAVSTDPHQLVVSPENFDDQLAYLKQNYQVVPLSTIAKNLYTRKLTKNQLAITFDDGYADNFYTAIPLLEKHGLPATIFITSGKIDSTEPYYWDKNTADADRGRPMTKTELIQLANHPLIEIGAHTVNHPKLSKISPAEQKTEVGESKMALEKILNQTVNSFAYPFGDSRAFTNHTKIVVQNAGFAFACANTQKKVRSSSDLFAIPRQLVRNWPLTEFRKKI